MKMRLLAKMLLFVLVPALIGLVVVAAVNYGASRNVLRSQLMADLDSMTDLQLSELRTASALLRGVLRSTTDVPQIVAYLEARANGAPADTLKVLDQRATSYLRDMNDNYSLLDGIGVTDPAGKIVLHSDAASVGLDISARQYFNESMRSGDYGVEDVQNKTNKDGANTIAAEFRTNDEDNELRRTAQNFRIETISVEPQPDTDPDDQGGSGNSGGQGGNGGQGGRGGQSGNSGSGNTVTVTATGGNSSDGQVPGQAAENAAGTASGSTVPQTGDSLPYTLCAVLALVSACGLAGLLIRRRKFSRK